MAGNLTTASAFIPCMTTTLRICPDQLTNTQRRPQPQHFDDSKSARPINFLTPMQHHPHPHHHNRTPRSRSSLPHSRTRAPVGLRPRSSTTPASGTLSGGKLCYYRRGRGLVHRCVAATQSQGHPDQECAPVASLGWMTLSWTRTTIGPVRPHVRGIRIRGVNWLMLILILILILMAEALLLMQGWTQTPRPMWMMMPVLEYCMARRR